MKAADTPHQIQEAVDAALELYAEGHVLNPEGVAEARDDFVRFFAMALRAGLRGSGWNFNGCILCDDPKAGVLVRRFLLIEPRIVAATQGRGFGTVVCRRHAGLLDAARTPPVVIEAALRRIRHEPPQGEA